MSALTTSTDDTDTDRVVSGGVPSRLRGNPWAIGIGVPVLFVLLILGANFLGKALDFPQYNYDTETAQLIVSGWPWLVLETAFALAVLWWTGLRVQGRPRWGQYVLLAVGVYLVFGVIVFLNEWNRGGAVDWYLLIGVFAACLLVGVNEELIMRGIALNSLARRVSINKAVLISAAIFGLAHFSNLLSGSTIQAVTVQVFFTFLMGIGFAWIYILSGRNLVLVALVHAAHNFLAIAPGAISGSRVPAYDMLDTLLTVGQQPVTGLITAGIPVALGLYGATQYRGKTLAEVMTELGPTDHEENRD